MPSGELGEPRKTPGTTRGRLAEGAAPPKETEKSGRVPVNPMPFVDDLKLIMTQGCEHRGIVPNPSGWCAGPRPKGPERRAVQDRADGMRQSEEMEGSD